VRAVLVETAELASTPLMHMFVVVLLASLETTVNAVSLISHNNNNKI